VELERRSAVRRRELAIVNLAGPRGTAAFVIAVCALALLLWGGDAWAELEEEAEEPRHVLTLFFGATANTETTAPTIGADYAYRAWPSVSVGAILDHAAGDIGTTLVGPAAFFLLKSFEITVAIAIEFGEVDARGVFRFGGGYEFKFSGGWVLVPGAYLDSERGADAEPALVFGVNIGREF